MKPDFSVIIPVYFNAGSLRYVENELRQKVLTRDDGLQGEIIFVDDGSADESYSQLRELKAIHPEDIRVYRLSRNFGQVHAIWCGYEKCHGPALFMAADGQEPVEIINQMLDAHFKHGKEVVIATRESRDESWWRKATSGAVYWLMKKLSNKDMPVGGFDFCLLGNKARLALIENWQPHTFLQARILSLGFSRDWIGYHREARKAGKSRWTFAKKLTYMLDGVLGHSYVPIRLISLMGIVFSASSFLLGMFFLLSYMIRGSEVRGLTPIMLLILFVGGMQMVMIGMLGEYLWRVLAQARKDVPYIVEESIE